jgi:hydroxyethylthiazole kinase-like uncharacterized protein yjeF
MALKVKPEGTPMTTHGPTLVTWRTRLPLRTAEETRGIELALCTQLAPHVLMERAGAAIARLARALTPHARRIWIACGPGNNGGDGLMAAALLAPWAANVGCELHVTWCGDERRMPPDAKHALERARLQGVGIQTSTPISACLGVDALLGIGYRTPSSGPEADPGLAVAARWKQLLESSCAQVLHVDLPSGMNADTGSLPPAWINPQPSGRQRPCHSTLTFLTAKPGLFTAMGREEAGTVWVDDLGTEALQGNLVPIGPARAWLGSPEPPGLPDRLQAPQQSHKGDFGDVWVLGGQGLHTQGQGMTGAAILAARTALHAGAGRVHVIPLGQPVPAWDPGQPELMFRDERVLNPDGDLPSGVWVCGCGGGQALLPHLQQVCMRAQTLVLDADALNALAAQPMLAHTVSDRLGRQQVTVLTPHPLEAARLLGCSTTQVQTDRLGAARSLALRFQSLVVLKGSGTVVATPSGQVHINTTGNPRLATAGTGDVLAGWMGALLARRQCQSSSPDSAPHFWALSQVYRAVQDHGLAADGWPPTQPLTAAALASATQQHQSHLQQNHQHQR